MGIFHQTYNSIKVLHLRYINNFFIIHKILCIKSKIHLQLTTLKQLKSKRAHNFLAQVFKLYICNAFVAFHVEFQTFAIAKTYVFMWARVSLIEFIRFSTIFMQTIYEWRTIETHLKQKRYETKRKRKSTRTRVSLLPSNFMVPFIHKLRAVCLCWYVMLLFSRLWTKR